jgi:hypothetical protein
MNRFRSLLNVKFLIAAGSLAVGVGAYVATLPQADAVIGPYVCTYYSSANYKNAVGARGNGCCGSVINWGITTSYKKCETVYCTDQICPN